jgi:hypothetical protein|tara:strand:+ start:4970 stop:6031 length:1062 start_codon:yes stop_codon:yes gene_type:complete
MDSMTNPESNARKMIKQNAEIGISPDVTTEILNKYATYGANTGIGNLGGGKLVDALNEHYRNQVDAPLQQDPPEMFIGGLLEGIRNAGANVGTYLKDVFTQGGEATGELVKEAPDAINSPVGVEGDAVDAAVQTADTATDTPVSTDEKTRMQRFKDYMEDNPILARELIGTGGTIAGILAKAAIGEDDTPASIRAPRPRFQPGKVRTQRIGMEEGGSVESENIYQNDPVYQTLSLLGLSDEAIDKFIKTTGDIPESVVDASIYIGQKLRDAGILEEPRAKKKEDGGTVLNRKMFLGGGEVDGPGGEKEDLVPIWASPNEYVVSAKGVRRMGGGDLQQGIAALDRINFGDERYG